MDGSAAGGTGGGQADRRAARAEALGQVLREGAEQEGFVFFPMMGGDRDELGIVTVTGIGDAAGRKHAGLPIVFGGRHGEEQRTGECGRTHPGLLDGFLSGKAAQFFRQGNRIEMPRQMIDRAGDGGAQALGGEAGDVVNAGLAGDQPAPVILLAGAERGDDTHAGHDNGRPGRTVNWHLPLLNCRLR